MEESPDVLSPDLEASERTALTGKHFTQYFATCKEHRILPCADALIRLEFGQPRLFVQADADREFGNIELKALVALLEADDGSLLRGFKQLDLSQCKLGVSSAFLIAQLLRHPECSIEELNLSFQPLGTEGAVALTKGIEGCKTLRRLRMHTCRLKDTGAEAFVKMLANGNHQLEYLDLQNNFIEYPLCSKLYREADKHGVELRLQGNRVFDEVWNAITHGSGFVMFLIGSVYMLIAVKDKPAYYMAGVVPYLLSLNILFLTSCLYHSFHALGRTVTTIFCNLDHSGIYALIAGTYTPFLVILFHGVWWANHFLWIIWGLAFVGIVFTIKYEGEYKMHIENGFYLLMGWICVLWIEDARIRMSSTGFGLLVAGGVLYSLGVPWFVKDGHTCGFPDHVTWHIFVLMASCCHFICIFEHIVGGHFEFHSQFT